MNINKIRNQSIATHKLIKEREKEEIRTANKAVDEAFNNSTFVSMVHDTIERVSTGDFYGDKNLISNPFMAIIPVPFKMGAYFRTESDKYLVDKMIRLLGDGFRCEVHGTGSIKVSWDHHDDWT